MVNGIFLEFDASNSAVVVLFVLGSNRDATIEVVLARSYNCPPKLRPDLYNKGFATITAFGQLPASMV